MSGSNQGSLVSRRQALGILAGTGISFGAAAAPLKAPAPGLIPIRMMDTPGRYASVESMYVAQEKGFLRAEGLELNLIPLQEQSAWALQSGTVDITASADYVYIINILDKGLKSVQVTSSLPKLDSRRANDGVFVLKDSPIRGPADLRGKTIGMTSVWFSCAWFIMDYASRAGVTADDMNYIVIPTKDLEQVLANGHVDAIFAFSPVDAIMRKRGRYRQLFSTGDLAGRPIERGATMVRDGFVKSNPDNLRRYVTAIANAIEWSNRNQDEVVHIGIKLGRLSASLAPWAYTLDGKGDYSVVTWPEYGLQTDADVGYWLDVVERFNVVPKGDLKLSDIYTNAFNPYAVTSVTTVR